MNKTIIHYLKEEIHCYEEILSLSIRQKDALLNGKESIIEGIIKEKERWIEKVKEIDKKLTAISFQPLVENLTKKIESILSEIIKIESECRGIIANSMTDLANEVKGLDKGKQIARVYSEKGIYTPKFISTKK